MRRRRTWWGLWLALICLGALAVRLSYIYSYKQNTRAGGDALYYHLGANYLVDGHGMVNPYYWIAYHQWVQGASHPPLWILVLALAAAVGVKSFFGQLVWACVVGTGAVAATGFAAREVAGRRAGLVAAVIAAIYPNYWLNDGLLMSETLVLLVVALAVLVAFRFWKNPRPLTAALFGAVCILCALTRSEMLLFVPFVLLPTTLALRKVPMRRRLKLLAVGLAAAFVTLAPWTAYNMTRFQNFELVSTEFGGTLASANCYKTYYGQTIGFWSFTCEADVRMPHVHEESVDDSVLRRHALDYISHHESRVPYVIVTRVGRELGMYAPIQQLHLDAFVELRPFTWALVGLGAYWALVPLALAGGAILVRRKVTVLPMLGILATVLVQAILTFGDTRYRASLEVALVVLAAVTIDAVLPRRRARRKVLMPVLEEPEPTIQMPAMR